MKDILDQVCLKYGLTVHQIKPGDERCLTNDEDKYINNCQIGGKDVYLGIYENDEWKLISFFHELGHMLISWEYTKDHNYNTLLIELECWNLGIEEAKKFGVFFSDGAIEFGYKKALSYVGHDEREYSDWDKRVSPLLWILKSKEEN